MKIDVQEMLHLALHASASGQHHACLMLLNELLEREPANAKALHLLASQHAELGLHDRAIRELQQALLIDPSMEIARFQLGVMLLDRRRTSDAEEQLSMVASSGRRSLGSFANALLAMARGDAAAARDWISRGLTQTPNNPAVSALMRKIHDSASSNTGPATPSNAADVGQKTGNLLFLGAYGQPER